MTTYQLIKELTKILDKHKVFFAFSNKQLEEGKEKIGIKDNKDLVSLGMGELLPKKNLPKYLDDMRENREKTEKLLKDLPEKEKEKAILYELNNHEAFYTGRLDEVIDIFDGIFTAEDINKVYKKYNN